MTVILGIKVGPQQQSFLDLALTRTTFAEVWFNISRANDYAELFDELKRRKVQVGLHFWGVLAGGISAGFGYPDQSILNRSADLVKKTIDIAARNKFQYVNIHPGSRAIVKIDLERMDYPYVSKPIDLKQSQSIFLEEVAKLHEYANDRGIVLTVETVSRLLSKTDWYNPEARLNPLDIYQLPVASIQAAGTCDVAVANDFVHTATNTTLDDPQDIWKFLYKTTQSLAPATRLIHLGFLVPPYNGTDFHDHLDNPLFQTNQAIPNYHQLGELLKLFQNRDDVWILVEPNGRHVENYFLAQKILEEALR